MFTYEMKIVNGDDCKKTIYVTSSSFTEAVEQMHREHGKGWTVYSYSIVHADY